MLDLLVGLLFISQGSEIKAAWSQTPHAIHIGGQQLDYTATAGFMPLTDDSGAVQAKIYFTAYNLSGTGDRPLTFVWNGGPGGSSLLLHMFCMGPRMLHQDSAEPSSAFHIVDNENTMLPNTDLVFVDPVGTGFSKAEKADPKTYWGVDGDIKATERFINSYLEATGRKKSPVFLAGESYGTFRAAGLARPILRDGVNVKGLILLSNAIHFDTFIAEPGNELPYDVFVPTYTATAAFYKKLKPSWNDHPEEAIAEAKRFAAGELWTAFAEGDALEAKKKHKLAVKLSELTSLSVEYIEKQNLRIDPDQFRFELFRKEGKHIDKNLGNMIGTINTTPTAAVTCFTNYVQTELNFKTDFPYSALNLGANVVWKYGNAVQGFPNESIQLAGAIVANPALKLFVGQGLYDFTTPFFGEEYSFRHLGLPDNLKKNWQYHTYEGGHMMYLNPPAHAKLKLEITEFLKSCL